MNIKNLALTLAPLLLISACSSTSKSASDFATEWLGLVQSNSEEAKKLYCLTTDFDSRAAEFKQYSSPVLEGESEETLTLELGEGGDFSYTAVTFATQSENIEVWVWDTDEHHAYSSGFRAGLDGEEVEKVGWSENDTCIFVPFPE